MQDGRAIENKIQSTPKATWSYCSMAMPRLTPRTSLNGTQEGRGPFREPCHTGQILQLPIICD